ncbi:hypothetical protein M3P36_05160 [Altererythrobacter sp. KTW20L]|nr:hypothetical protein [Altererythrobacter sp. KTW20L]
MPAHAERATAQFGLRLVIEPACADGQAKAVASEEAAVELASTHLAVPVEALRVEHDERDTGYWLVSDQSAAVLRIEKCTGEITRT